MSEYTNIGWTDHSWNPWIGCSKVSPGCANCYAAEQNKLRKWTAGGEWGKERTRTSAANWRKPLQWNDQPMQLDERGDGHRKTRVFCASLADWLDDEVPVEWLADLLSLIHATPNLDWLLLSKRPEKWGGRVTLALNELAGAIPGDDRPSEHPSHPFHLAAEWLRGYPPPNVWIGATAENQEYMDVRSAHLRKIPAGVRFLSVEPMLGPVKSDLEGINWIICGGESGGKRRPFEPAWTEDLAAQCSGAGVPFFMKQDAGRFPGTQGRLPDALWNRKEFPTLAKETVRV